jgi:hypothetical protein
LTLALRAIGRTGKELIVIRYRLRIAAALAAVVS